ncbi:TonB-dependent receptor domain-containing protein [Paremcibacter congregatus]|uniref:Secretin/TonB short N-terminal domain-containing protein n=1 Tax=Paremcibacter congregatus TaxID=2043170 RepID=A0A2G4YR44_9PROT|nr:TonB-dependent receptor [Paremcibacter congregatus]PHZ84740.1 hypothetical protein CRD36_10670 [Paremcibacter congregatus]QDE28933.1 hypothetical protein FIV45_17435 [Paremcibacter congregatus]
MKECKTNTATIKSQKSKYQSGKSMADNPIKGLALTSCLAILMGTSVTSVGAQEVQRVERFNLQSMPLSKAIANFSKQTGIVILASNEAFENKDSVRISGHFEPTQALEILLKNSGLVYRFKGENTIVISPISAQNIDLGNGFEKISFNTLADYEASLAPYDDDERADEVENVSFDEIIVTASRREQNLQDVPMAITAVRPEEFTSKGMTNLSDVIAFTPGFDTGTSTLGGPPGIGNLTARGVGQQAVSPVVGVYVDDAPVSSNIFAAFFVDGLLLDLERVEFLKGPQGTLYGATSIGGAVKYITRKPSLDEFRGTAAVNLSSTKHGSFNQIYNGRISMPIVEDKLGLTVSGFYEDNGGFVDLVDGVTRSLVKNNADTYERYGYAADLLFAASDRLDIRLSYMRQNADWGAQKGGQLIVDDNLVSTYGLYKTIGNPDDKQNLDSDIYSGTLNYQFDWGTLTSVSSYLTAGLSLNIDQVGFIGFVNTLPGHPTGTDTGVPTITLSSYKKYIQEVRLTSEVGDHFDWIVGLYYTDEDAVQSRAILGFPSGFDITSADARDSYNEYAVFGNFTYHFTPDLDVTVGGRVSRQNVGFANTQSGVLSPDNGVLSNEIDATADTWSAAVAYRPREGMSLYARVASGFRPARTNAPVSDGNGRIVSSTLVAPDTLWSYEVGAKGTMDDGLFTYDMALWYIDWGNFQTNVSIGAINYIGNAADGLTAKGFEGAFSLNLLEGLSLVSTIAYADSTLNDNEPLIFGLKGQQVPGVPKWSASINGQYGFALGSNLEGHVGGGLRYSSSRPSAFDDGTPTSLTVNLLSDSYVLADFNAGFTKGAYSFNFYVTNLFDKLAYKITSASPSRASTATPVTPRTIGMVLSASF